MDSMILARVARIEVLCVLIMISIVGHDEAVGLSRNGHRQRKSPEGVENEIGDR